MSITDPLGNKWLLEEAARFSRLIEKSDPGGVVAAAESARRNFEELRKLGDDIANSRSAALSYSFADLAVARQFGDQLSELRRSLAMEGLRDSIAMSISAANGLRDIRTSIEVARDLGEWWSRFIPDLQIDWDAVARRVSASLEFAAAHGWFPTGEREEDVMLPLEDLGCDVELLHELFEEHVSALMDQIGARLQRDFPHREPVIAEAMALLREERYIAAIPLLLSTADGIAHETTGKSAFGEQKVQGIKRTRLVEWVTENSDSSSVKVYLEHLAKPHQLSASRVPGFTRHRVMHGLATDFGTRRNALQALAFVGYLGWVVTEVRKPEP